MFVFSIEGLFTIPHTACIHKLISNHTVKLFNENKIQQDSYQINLFMDSYFPVLEKCIRKNK